MKNSLIGLLGLITLIACNDQNKANESIIQSQSKTIDSLVKRSQNMESKPTEEKVNNQRPIISQQPKFVVAVITYNAATPEYKKVYDETPTDDGPLPDVETQKSIEKIRESRSHDELFYQIKAFTCYSQIRKIPDLNEDKKNHFLDEVTDNLKSKNRNLQKIIKRECLVFNSYSAASKWLESVEEN
jgi:hypothetical protein